MFRYLNKILSKRSKKEKQYKLHLEQRISLIKRTGANKVVSNQYVSIDPDSTLIFKGEKDGKLFFKVKNNYIPREFEARNDDMVYYYLQNFIKLQYKRK